MALEWRLRKVMAERGVWSGSELRRLMMDKSGFVISPPSISALLTGEPRQMKAETMDALCTALQCTPSDLWAHTPTYNANHDKRPESSSNVVNGVPNKNVLPPF